LTSEKRRRTAFYRSRSSSFNSSWSNAGPGA
jgi:hypothetical protein